LRRDLPLLREGSRLCRRAQVGERPAAPPVEVDVLEQGERGVHGDLAVPHLGGVEHEKPLCVVAAEDDDPDNALAFAVEHDVDAATEPNPVQYHGELQELRGRIRHHGRHVPATSGTNLQGTLRRTAGPSSVLTTTSSHCPPDRSTGTTSR